MKAIVGFIGIIIVVVIIGLTLSIFVQGSRTEPNPCNDLLVVTRNETVESIAQRCGVDTNTIYNLNPGLLEDGVELDAGMVLRLGEDVDLDDAADGVIPDVPSPTPSM